jgi:aryl-alcohol dehydrogenase-like predicted oxidoreductase
VTKLAIGTAQFGMSYGVADQIQQVDYYQVDRILSEARKLNIDLLDTAITYGDSETVLGSLGVQDFRIVSKLPPLTYADEEIQSWVKAQIQNSLTRLKVPSLYGLLLHRPQDLIGQSGKKLKIILEHFRETGKVQKLGVSIYSPCELNQITDVMALDIVQAPLSLIDRRLETSGWLQRLCDNGIEIHTRSTFLQGLLLLQRDKIPRRFEPWQHLWDRWASELERNSLNALVECLSYPLSLPCIDRVVVGLNSIRQLRELHNAYLTKDKSNDWSFMASNDERLINCFNWQTL